MKRYLLEPIDIFLKRLIDIAGALGGLILLSPLLVVVGIAMKMQDNGPILYRASRIGKDGRLFHLYKFRTMIVNADQQGPAVTTNGDSRITPIGRWLRRTKLDELPQLLNVLIGDMSLVGPRPEAPQYVDLYTPEQRTILRARPGITSAASLTYRHEEQMLVGPDWETTYRNEVMPAKIAIDLDYLSHRNVLTDIRLIVRTVQAIAR